MSEDTVTVDGEEYIFPPDQICKPEKTAEKEENKVIWQSGDKQ